MHLYWFETIETQFHSCCCAGQLLQATTAALFQAVSAASVGEEIVAKCAPLGPRLPDRPHVCLPARPKAEPNSLRDRSFISVLAKLAVIVCAGFPLCLLTRDLIVRSALK